MDEQEPQAQEVKKEEINTNPELEAIDAAKKTFVESLLGNPKERELTKTALEKFIGQHSKNKNISVSFSPNFTGSPDYNPLTKTLRVPNKLIKTKNAALPGLLLHEIGHANDLQLTIKNVLGYNVFFVSGCYITGGIMGALLGCKLYKKIPTLKNHPTLSLIPRAVLTGATSLTGGMTGKFISAQTFAKKREIFADQYAAQNCITKKEGLALIELLIETEAHNPSWLKYLDSLFVGHPTAANRKKIIKKVLNQRTFLSTPTQKSLWKYIEEEFAAANEPLPWL